MVQWLDARNAATLNASGSTLVAWADASGGSGGVATVTGSPQLVAASLNGWPSVSLSSAIMQGGSVSKSSSVTVAVVAMLPLSAGPSWGGLWAHCNNGAVGSSWGCDMDIALRFDGSASSAGSALNWHTNNNIRNCDLGVLANVPVVFIGTMAGGTTLYFEETRLDTGAQTTATYTGAATIATPDPQPIQIGGSVNPTSGLLAGAGFIGEVIYYQSVLSGSQLTWLRNYLVLKWQPPSPPPSSPSPPPPRPPPPAPPPALSAALTASSTPPLHNYALSGSTWTDSGSAPLAATLSGGAAALPGSGLYFPPTGSPYACMPALLLGGSDVSFAVWAQIGTLNTSMVIFSLGVQANAANSCSGVDTSNFVALSTSGGDATAGSAQLAYQGVVSSVKSSAGFWAPGVWRHCVLTVSLAGNATLYGSGSAVGAFAVQPGLLQAPVTFHSAFLGRSQYASAGNNYLNGLIAEFQIYGNLVTPGQVRSVPWLRPQLLSATHSPTLLHPPRSRRLRPFTQAPSRLLSPRQCRPALRPPPPRRPPRCRRARRLPARRR